MRLSDWPWPYKALLSTQPSPYQGQQKEKEPLQGPSCVFLQVEIHRGPLTPTQSPTVNPKLPDANLPDGWGHLFLTTSSGTMATAMVTAVSCQTQTLPARTRLQSLAAWTIYNLAEERFLLLPGKAPRLRPAWAFKVQDNFWKACILDLPIFILFILYYFYLKIC